MLLEPMTVCQFRNIVDIRFSNINDGFSSYGNGILEVNDKSLNLDEIEKCFIEFFRLCYKNNIHGCYIDFYLKNLQEENIKYLLDNLDGKYKETFELCLEKLDKETIYFRVNGSDYMDLITILNVRSLFFCTVYLVNSPITIWGNYNYSFPIFFKDKNNLEEYDLLAKQCGLVINCINYKEKDKLF